MTVTPKMINPNVITPNRITPNRITRAGQVSGRSTRRVREEVKDGIAVIAFSAGASSALAGALLILVRLVN